MSFAWFLSNHYSSRYLKRSCLRSISNSSCNLFKVTPYAQLMPPSSSQLLVQQLQPQSQRIISTSKDDRIPLVSSPLSSNLISQSSMSLPISILGGRQISSTTQSLSSWSPSEIYRNRTEKKEKEKLLEQLEKMATQDVWTLKDHIQELDETANNWKTKLPLVRSSKEVTVAKELHKTISALIEVMGEDVTSDELQGMGRLEKLRAADIAEKTVEDINQTISQFQSMSITQRIVRKLRLDGKPLPDNPKEFSMIVRRQAENVMSKSEKNIFAKKRQNKYRFKRK